MDTTFDDHAGGAPARRGGAPRLATGVTLNDRYQIDDFIGRSPYGEVYRGRDLSDGRLVTIKAVTPQLLADAQVRTRLEREIQLAVQLDHKNIGTTYGLFGAMVGNDPVAYLASEYIDGQTLREMIEKKRAAGRTFSLKGTYNVVAHLCNALSYAHGATVHGGLSPDSVLVNSAGRVKVVDFGLARTLRALDHFQAQVGAGGLATLPPEMAAAPESADARADLYSVGVILFELLTGRAPSESFEHPSTVAPGVPPAVDDVVARCLQPRPEDRFADAQSVKEALHAALGADLEGASTTQGVKIQPAAPTPPPVAPKAAPPAPPARPPAQPPASSAPRPPMPTAAPTPTPPPMARPPGPGAPHLQTPGIAKSFNVDAALSAVDDSTERWLIQKDKLDFGPFNLRDVRSQIESGKILGEHTIVDTESGERRKVKDHPQLRQLVLEAEARLSEKSRQDAEDQARNKQRGRVVALLGGMFVLVIGVLGGGFLYGQRHHWFEQKVVKEVVHDGADLDFLKGVQITMKVDKPPAHHSTHRRSGHGGAGGNQYSDVTNLGDATGGGGDETLDQTVVQQVMSSHYRVLVGCIAEERHRNSSLHSVDMDFVIKGSGSVSGVKVNGQTGSAFARCMFGKMQTITFPKFNGSQTHASFSLAFR